jgi:hypothetical protein
MRQPVESQGIRGGRRAATGRLRWPRGGRTGTNRSILREGRAPDPRRGSFRRGCGAVDEGMIYLKE